MCTIAAGLSLPVRGAWIEIFRMATKSTLEAGRSPCGERGLKCGVRGGVAADVRRSPCGERGLKSESRLPANWACPSLPVRGAWIEMSQSTMHRIMSMSLPVRGAWIEITHRHSSQTAYRSLPVRGAWIEIWR